MKTQKELEDIIRYYGSLEVYNEEQRRCSLATIEATMEANPFTKQVRIKNALPVEVVKAKLRPRRFWLKLFGQKV